MHTNICSVSTCTQCLECCWDKLLRKTNAASDLDQVIAAHNEFLTVVTTRCLLDPSSQVSHPWINGWF